MPFIPLDLWRGRLDRWCALIAAGVAFLAAPTEAGAAGDLSGLFAAKLEAIDTTIRSGRWEGYVTGYAWHLPWGYDARTRSRLNETTWGGGVGRSTIDADGDRHAVFVVSFTDSHRDAQFIVSYGWQRYWTPARDLSFGWGYQAFLFARKDVAHYLPLPAVLPCASIRYRRWEAVGMFVPKVSKDIKGDVFFVFTRVAL